MGKFESMTSAKRKLQAEFGNQTPNLNCITDVFEGSQNNLTSSWWSPGKLSLQREPANEALDYEKYESW